MKENNKTKEQLIHELTELRSQNATLKKLMTGSISAELVVEEARRYAENIVETVREPLLILDADLKIISANRNFYRTFKVTPGETIGSFIYDLRNKQWDIPKLRELLEEILPEKEAFDDFEVAHNFQDIGHKIMQLNARRIIQKEIGFQMILLAMEDITERSQLKSLLEVNEAKYRELVQNANSIILKMDPEGNVTFFNEFAQMFFGYTEEEMLGRSVVGTIIPETGSSGFDPDFMIKDIGINPEKYITNENENMRRNGERVWVAWTNKAIRDGNGKVIEILCIGNDITERRRLEILLSESEERYRRLFETASDAIVLLEKREGKITHANPATEKMLGYTNKESIGNKLKDIGILLDMDDFQTTMQKLNKSGIINYDDVPAITKSGQHIDTDIYLVDRARLVQCNIRDITDRKQAEEALRESEKRYKALFDGSLDLIYVTDFEGRFIDANAAALNRLGYTREDIRSLNFASLLSEDQLSFALKTIQDIREPGIGMGLMEFRLRHKNGSEVYVETHGSTIMSNGTPVAIQAIARDITERKRTEEKLQHTLVNLRKAMGGIIQVISGTVETKDPYTAGHQRRVADLARAIATEMGLADDQREGLRMAGTIHDLGKISVPAEILSKPTKLSEIEYKLIQAHPQIGYDILKGIEFPWPIAEMVLQHHERMNGSGYPRGLKEEAVSLEARILMVADVVEAMASYRPYRPALGVDAALEEIEKNKGILYDPEVAEVCLRLFREKGFRFE